MTQRRLHIASNLSLPLEFATSTQAILAIRGAGKTYTASVVAEEMLKSKVPVIIIDPTGSWWGLKSSKDGAAAGYPIVVFGGEHADVPLEDTAGEAIARAIVEHRFSAILDLKLLRKGQWYRLLAPFLETLYHLNREPVHMFVDEAHRIAPQRLPKGAVEPARVLGAMEDIAQMGRSRGLGCTVISQRPAVINKNVLTQCPVLCCLRVVHNLDLDAVRDWVKEQADLSEAEEMIRTLPSLPTGDAWFWWPEEGIQKRVRVRERETFDSSKTPKVGEKIRPPKVMADVDIQQLGEQIKATVERAKADDPKILKARVQQLERELKSRPSGQKVGEREKIKTVEKIVPVPMPEIPKAVFKYLEDLQKDIQRVSGVVSSSLGKLGESGTRTATSLQQMCDDLRAKNLKRAPVPKFEPKQYGVTVNPSTGEFRNNPDGGPLPYPASSSSPSNGDSNLSGLKERILKVLAEFESIGRRSVRRTVISARAEARGGYFTNTVGNMRSEGLIDYPSAGLIAMTDKGRSMAAVPESPIDNAGMYESCMRNLSGLEQRIFSHLYKKYPEAMSRDALSEAVQARGGYFTNTIGHMRSMEFVEYPSSGMVRCPDWVFVE